MTLIVLILLMILHNRILRRQHEWRGEIGHIKPLWSYMTAILIRYFKLLSWWKINILHYEFLHETIKENR